MVKKAIGYLLDLLRITCRIDSPAPLPFCLALAAVLSTLTVIWPQLAIYPDETTRLEALLLALFTVPAWLLCPIFFKQLKP